MPLGAHYLLARGEWDNFPSPISPVSFKFLQACLLPLARLRKLLGVSEASGFSDGGQVGIGSGVEVVIRIRGLVRVIREKEKMRAEVSAEEEWMDPGPEEVTFLDFLGLFLNSHQEERCQVG